MNVGQLASFDVMKNLFADYTDFRDPALPAAFMAGLSCATVSLPFDYAKSQLQKSN